jgi:hypothetical protein
MKWDIQIAFEVYRGRRRIFSLRRLIPLFQRWYRQSKDRARSCYSKTRYPNEQAAMNAGWFKKHTVKHAAYNCEVCDGWHITTKEQQ